MNNPLIHLLSNPAAEEGLVGSLLIGPSPEQMDEVFDEVGPYDISRLHFHMIFHAVRRLRLSGGPIDVLTVTDELSRAGELDRVGGTEALGALANSVPHAVNVAYFAKIVRDYAVSRRVIEVINEIAGATLSRNLTRDELLDFIEAKQHWFTRPASSEWRTFRELELSKMPYPDYLLTPDWRETRDAQLKADGWACRVCGSKESLNVHHRTYERRGYEAPGDLITLCRCCHQLFHDHGKLAKPEG